MLMKSPDVIFTDCDNLPNVIIIGTHNKIKIPQHVASYLHVVTYSVKVKCMIGENSNQLKPEFKSILMLFKPAALVIGKPA